MWFKNLLLYRLPAPWTMTLEQLEEKLSGFKFRRCASNELQTRGWSSPQRNGPFVFASNRHWLIALETEQRILPSSVVNDFTKERAADIEQEQGFPLGRKQLKDLKEQITQELMPKAFTRRRTTFAWIDPVNGWFVVDASNASRAEELIELLRKSLTDLPLTLINTEQSPAAAMANWLISGEAPAGFTVDRDCELKEASEEKATVRYVRHALDGEEISRHLAAGKTPTRLAMTWNDRVSFVVTERLEIKRLNFLDAVKEEGGDAANREEQFETDFVLMTGELVQFIPHVLESLGGEVKPQ